VAACLENLEMLDNFFDVKKMSRNYHGKHLKNLVVENCPKTFTKIASSASARIRCRTNTGVDAAGRCPADLRAGLDLG